MYGGIIHEMSETVMATPGRYATDQPFNKSLFQSSNFIHFDLPGFVQRLKMQLHYFKSLNLVISEFKF